MTTLDDSLADCQSATSDTSATSQTKFIQWLNRGYASMLSQFGSAGIIKTVQTTTNVPHNPMQDSDRSYAAPPDFLFIKNVKIQIGSRYYDLVEEEAEEMWNYRTQYVWGGIPSLFFVKDNFGFASGELQINPICSPTTQSATTYTPTSATLSGTNLALTFSSTPIWTTGNNITLAGFFTNLGQELNGSQTVSSVSGDTVNITIANAVSDTVSTIGTVGTTIGVPMTITYESMDINMDHIGVTVNPLYPFQTKTNASVQFTYNSNIVTASSGIFQPWMTLGGTYITAGDDGDGNWYKIVSLNSSTSANIGQLYQNTTVNSQNYWSINQVMNLHPDMVDIPNHYALWKYYLYKKDSQWKDYYKTMYYDELKLAKGNWATKSRSSIIRSKQGVSRWHTYPGWFPASGVNG